ncbi:MAG: PQQ-binding-like beta-propeller repeat protein [Chloroflexota bacterium]|nr:PQQ-binding-like beta-propeller repeat protein [Chloroflexota bacterium]
MRKEKFLVIITGLVLILVGVSCLIVDLPLELIDRIVPKALNEAAEGLSTNNTPDIIATSTDTFEPTTKAPTAADTSLVECQDTCMHRGNLARMGVYQSPGPKSLPDVVWTFEASAAIYSSPAIYDGAVYFGSDDGNLYAVDITSGELLWAFPTGDRVVSSPAIANGILYFGGNDGYLYALKLSSGEVLWSFETGNRVTSSPAISGGMVYFGSDDGFLYALDALTGEEVWKFEVAGIDDLGSSVHKTVSNSPAISGDTVLFGSNQNGGASKELFFYALDKKTGQKLWEKTIWNVITSPAVFDGVVYFGGFFEFYGLTLSNGSDAVTINYDTCATSPPAIFDNKAYFGCDYGLLHAVDVNAAVEKWVIFSGDYLPLSTAPSVADSVVYFGSGDGFLIAVDIQTQEILWKFDTGVQVSTSPVISGGVVYFGNEAGTFFAVK